MEELFYLLMIGVALRYFIQQCKANHALKLEKASLITEVNILIHEKVEKEKHYKEYEQLKTYIGCLLLIIFTKGSVTAQKISYTKNRLESNMTIYVTKYRGEADLIVYRTSDRSIKKPCVWITGYSRLESDLIIWQTPYRNEAEKIVYYTNNINETDCR